MSEPQAPIDETVYAFVRLCLRARWEPGALEAAAALTAQAQIDDVDLIQVADEGRLAPLLYHVVRGQGLISPPVEAALRSARHGHALRDRLLRQELAIVLDHLSAKGIEVLLLKGAALSQTVYDHTGLRPMGDLDLLVRPDDAPAALQTLGDLGYRSVAVEPRPGTDLAFENEVRLSKPGLVEADVEVHWSLFDSPYYQRALSLDWFWQTAEQVQIEGRPAQVLGPEAQLLHLCGHLLLHHGGREGVTLLWLHDVAEVLQHYQDEIDWHELLVRTVEFELVLPVQRVLTQVATESAAPIPAEVLARLNGLRPSAEEAQIVARLTAKTRPVAQRFWSDLASMGSWRQRLHYAWISLFPSPGFMQHRYGIRHRLLVPLYYPYRWWLGLRSSLSR